MPQKRKSLFFSFISTKLFIAAGLAVLLFVGVSLGKELVRRHQISEKAKSFEAEIQRLEESSTELAGLIDYLKSESYQEREARLKLGLQKEGETVVVIPKSELDPASYDREQGTGPASSAKTEDLSNIQKWWRYFFK